jgi:hypothetical protein
MANFNKHTQMDAGRFHALSSALLVPPPVGGGRPPQAMNGSPPLQLNSEDLRAILRGALLAAGGAVIAYLSTEVLPHLDQSTMAGALIAGVGATVLNVLRKYLTDTR